MPNAAPLHRAAGWKPPAERKAEIDLRRGTRSQRGYDATWQKLRREFLKQHTTCECDECKASGSPHISEVVDHIESIALRPDLRLVWSNLRAMSKTHHDRHTAKTQGIASARNRVSS